MKKSFKVKSVDVTNGGMVVLEIPFSLFLDETGNSGSQVSPGDELDLASMVIQHLIFPDIRLECVENLVNEFRGVIRNREKEVSQNGR